MLNWQLKKKSNPSEYDNILMEEVAILEIKIIIPLLLQTPQDGFNRLKRQIMIGDYVLEWGKWMIKERKEKMKMVNEERKRVMKFLISKRLLKGGRGDNFLL